ncbi:MAG: TetR/AcrR family transcriptional regulator [Caulobacterales bacterium]|jgi:AcrR family transcriptional regulator
MSIDAPDTRLRIVQATVKLLEGGEAQAIRMTDIADRAGVSRQAVYLHFATRAELLAAATHYIEDVHGSQERLAASRAARTGLERLDAYIDAWGNFIPDIFGAAKALMAMSDADDAAATTWRARMRDMREGCEAAILALKRDKMLAPRYSPAQATDLLWMLLSVRNWEHLNITCGWSQTQYIDAMKAMARDLFVKDGASTRRARSK